MKEGRTVIIKIEGRHYPYNCYYTENIVSLIEGLNVRKLDVCLILKGDFSREIKKFGVERYLTSLRAFCSEDMFLSKFLT